MLTIIYPHDATTNFLLAIPEFLIQNFSRQVSYLHLDDKTNYSITHDLIRQTDKNSIILFLGHGSSSCLHGSPENNVSGGIFVSKENLSVFNQKNLFCLSCNSNDFLRRNKKSTSIIKAIGFGDLPTSWAEVIAARESDINAYSEYTEDIISEFVEILVVLVKNSFYDYFERNLNFTQLVAHFELHLNKTINNIILRDSRRAHNRKLANLLYNVKSELYYT